jgi:hypothetical protein
VQLADNAALTNKTPTIHYACALYYPAALIEPETAAVQEG